MKKHTNAITHSGKEKRKSNYTCESEDHNLPF